MKITKVSWLALAALMLSAQPARAEMPKGKPFSMRGVELGITLDAFRELPIPNDNNRFTGPETRCSNDEGSARKVVDSGDDQDIGIIECQWFSIDTIVPYFSSQQWIDIGTGKGQPTFQFIQSGTEPRLFRIKFYANNEYYDGINDALTRGYGAPSSVVEPFKTKAGADFTSIRSVWDNGYSSITLVERCGHLERYCLTYAHSELIKPYLAIKEKKAAEAAGKL